MTEVGEDLRHIIHGDRRLGGAIGAVRPDARESDPDLKATGCESMRKETLSILD